LLHRIRGNQGRVGNFAILETPVPGAGKPGRNFVDKNQSVYLYNMTTMTLQVLEKDHDETVRLIAAKLYEAEKITLGQAAEMCGMKKWDYAEILVNYGVHFFEDYKLYLSK
jgi:predicted HTH domain antitoxin